MTATSVSLSAGTVLLLTVLVVGICVSYSAGDLELDGVAEWGFVQRTAGGLVEGVAFANATIAQVPFENLSQSVRLRRPALVRAAEPALEWPALRRWKQKGYLAGTIDELHVVTSEQHVNIHLAKDRPMGSYMSQQLEESRSNEENEIPSYEQERRLAEMQESLQRKHSSPRMKYVDLESKFLNSNVEDNNERNLDQNYYYGTTNLKSICNRTQLCSDLPGISALFVQDPLLNNVPTETNQLYMWIGKPGVVAGTHYDVFHNLFAQITGRKRFLIMNITDAERIFLFPYLHPHSRHSMLELDSLDIDWKKSDLPVEMHVIDLEPGDILYIPPHWLHRVLPLPSDDDLSISVNGWTASTEAVFADFLRKLPLPPWLHLQDTAVPQRLATLYHLCVSTLLDTLVPAISDRKKFLEQLLKQRYNGKIASMLSCSSCPSGLATESSQSVEGIGTNDQVLRSKKALAFAMEKASTVSQIKSEALRILAADYVEVLMHHAFGYPQACTYLHCLIEMASELSEDTECLNLV